MFKCLHTQSLKYSQFFQQQQNDCERFEFNSKKQASKSFSDKNFGNRCQNFPKRCDHCWSGPERRLTKRKGKLVNTFTVKANRTNIHWKGKVTRFNKSPYRKTCIFASLFSELNKYIYSSDIPKCYYIFK